MKKIFNSLAFMALVSFLFLAVSCESIENPAAYPVGKGFFLLNEGNYLAGNGSISFYSLETGEIYNDLFGSLNGRSLGDIPSCIATNGDRGYIVVNNSGTIEEVDLLTMESLRTLTGLDSPRQMIINGGKGYVSSLQSQAIKVIDLDNMEVSGELNIGATSESMVITGGRLFTAHWSGGNSVIITDLESGQFIKSLTVGLEPESMVLDKDGKLWVLCTGGWMGEEIPRIVRINTATLEIEAEFLFRTVDDNPSCLTSNSTGDTLYYIDEGVRQMPVTASSLPAGPFILSGGRLFYKIVTGRGGLVAVTDAIDYQQKGDFLVYNSRAELADTEQAGIIPGFMLYVND